MLQRIMQVMFFAAVIKPFMLLFIGLRVRGRNHLPRSGPFLLIANHSSHLDTIALLSLFPLAQLSRIRPVAAADYFERNRAISWFSRTFFHILPIARAHITAQNNPLDTMRTAIAAGESLILFPEGTRGSGEAPGKFRAGAAHLVEHVPDVPVVPAYLVNMGRSLPKGAYIPVPFFCEIRFGPPLKPQGRRREILEQLESAVQELQEWH